MTLERELRLINANTHGPYMAGEDVRAVQARLIWLGYDLGKDGADGEYGPITAAAVHKYQLDTGLRHDSVVGTITWGALFPVVATKNRKNFVEFVASKIGCLYVSGGQGETATAAWIKRMEKDLGNRARAMAHFNKHVKSGETLQSYDCSGLVVHGLMIAGLIARDKTANGLFYDECNAIQRQELQAGDLIFYKGITRITHVGIYMGDGTVVEAKGRSYGVVRTPINSYHWNRYGRLKYIDK